ncbi:hypothetical protein CR513_33498, partial [Mucuna pruriens]
MAIVVDNGATEAKSLSSTDPLYAFDPEIEKTLRRLRRTRNLIVNNSRSSDSVVDSNLLYTDILVSSSNTFIEPGQMENHDRTLKELATPDVVYQPWCIQYPQLEPAQTYELKSGLIHLLPKFHGLVGEDPHKHLTEFHVVCSTMRQERFNKLCATCPHHQISEQLLIQYVYKGLSIMDKSMIDAANRGALMDKTLAATRHLIFNMASNTQQFGIKGSNQSRVVNEIGVASNQRLENQLAVSQHQLAMAAKICGICTSMEHPIDMCPTLQETESDQPEHVGAVGGFQNGKQQYQTRPFDNQQHTRQLFQTGPQQGPYGAQSAGSVPNVPYGAVGYQQPSPQYPAQAFPQ